MKFFGEKPTSATTEDFFGIFAAFIMNFEVSDHIDVSMSIAFVDSRTRLCLSKEEFRLEQTRLHSRV